MLEIAALAGLLMALANMASERRLNVMGLVTIAAVGWAVLALLFRYLMPLGLIMALTPWLFVAVLFVFVRLREIPRRVRTYDGLEELTESLAEAQRINDDKGGLSRH